MRAVRIVLTILGLSLFSIPAHAEWCAVYRNGGNNCGFATFQQCMAAVSGVGGLCNTSQYSRPEKTAGPQRASTSRRERRESQHETRRERIHQARAKTARQVAKKRAPSEEPDRTRGAKLSPGDDDHIRPAEPD
jgi:hypothetical protein